MYKIFTDFKEKVNFIDKFLLIFIVFQPFLLATSIFLADLFSSISGIILIYIFFKKKISFFRIIRKEIILMISFYLIILTSLLFTEYFKISFLASFFYFRYFLVSLSIFYLLKKYDFFITIFLYSLMFTILIVLIDALIQYHFGKNLFGYDWPGRVYEVSPNFKYITGFFNEEKKLGSYLVRFLPLMLAAIYWKEKRYNNFLGDCFLLFVGIIVYLASERTALFLYFIISASYLLINKNKLRVISCLVLVFGLLFYLQPELKDKYVKFTIKQIEGRYTINGKRNNSLLNDKTGIRYYSYEHENLVYTSVKIFQENYLFGSGVKTFYHECNNLKKGKLKEIAPNNRKNKMMCSTHPHSAYFQILSDIGVFGLVVALYFLYYVILTWCKFFINICKNNKINISYYFINLGVLVSIFPLIPSGNIFNNWISLILFYLLGFWLFLKKEIYSKEDINSCLNSNKKNSK